MQTSLAYIFKVERSDSLIEELGTKRTRREVKEELVTVLAEPGSRYLGHFASSSGTAKNIANGLIEFCKDKQI